MKKTTAYMYNLNADPFLTGHIINFFDTPAEKIGNGKDEARRSWCSTVQGRWTSWVVWNRDSLLRSRVGGPLGLSGIEIVFYGPG